jgi:hypothetical protein
MCTLEGRSLKYQISVQSDVNQGHDPKNLFSNYMAWSAVFGV